MSNEHSQGVERSLPLDLTERVSGRSVRDRSHPGASELGSSADAIAALLVAVAIQPAGTETEPLPQLGNQNLMVAMHRRTHARPEDTVQLHIGPAKSHLFTAHKGARIA